MTLTETRPPVLAWNPRDTLELKMVDRSQDGELFGLIPLDQDIEHKRLGLGQKTSLNGAWKVPTGTDGPMSKFWARLVADTTLSWDERKKRYLAELDAKQDEMFLPPLEPHRWTDCEIAGRLWYDDPIEPWDPAKIKTDWLGRIYLVNGLTLERCYLHHSGGYFCDGHGIYLGMYGDLTVRDCLFDELGGNPIQLTNREDEFKLEMHDGEETWFPKIDGRQAKGGKILIERSVFGETGYADGRGSYPISIVSLGRPGRQYDVTLDQGLISCHWPVAQKGHRSRGGILVEGAMHTDWSYDTVSVKGYRIDVWSPDRQLVAINNAASVVVTGNTFVVHDGSPWIDYDRLDFEGFAGVKPCGRVEHYGNKGNGKVRLRGKEIGPCDKSYVFENGVAKTGGPK